MAELKHIIAETSSKKSLAKCLVCNSYPPHPQLIIKPLRVLHLVNYFFIKRKQNVRLDAAKFLSGRKKIFIETQENFHRDATKFSSRRNKCSVETDFYLPRKN